MNNQVSNGQIPTNIGKLGFGMMRLPKNGIKFDDKQIAEMVDDFLAAGFTYFDTAYFYVGSEKATRRALLDRYPRESFQLATKLYAGVAPSEKAAKKELATSLERCGTDYFDFYLLHSLTEGNYRKYDKWGLWDFVGEQKAKGVLKHIGFSFHAGPELLDQILTEHPEAEFVQLQINCADWNDPGIQARQNYEVARKHGKPIIIMEPVKGGKLANPPKKVQELMKSVDPRASYASWAMRYAASLDGVLTVLSGMSNLAQMEDNIRSLKDLRPLNAQEMKVIEQAQTIMGKSNQIRCTSCGYCLEGCPENIQIPRFIDALNLHLVGASDEQMREAYERAAAEGSDASECIECGACNETCPQHIDPMNAMARAAELRK